MERPSSWAAGLGLGLLVAGTNMVKIARGEWPLEWWLVPLLFGLACLGGVPFGYWLLAKCWDAISALADLWAQADAYKLAACETASPTAPTSPLVAGGLDAMTDLERYVQDGLLLTLEHARAAGGLTWDAIGHAFGKREHWVWWTNVLAASRLADKANGVPTTLPNGRTWWWAIQQVRQGNFEPPVSGPLPPPPAPLPFPAPGKEKPGKAGNAE